MRTTPLSLSRARTDAICSGKCATLVVFTNAAYFFDEIFWTSMASKLKRFYSTALEPKLANIL